MKKTSLLFFCCFFISVISFAQENSLLWKISGKDLKNESYIFGTIHIMCPDDFELKDKVKKALSASKVLTVEVDTDSPENKQLIQKLMAPNPDFLKSLSDEQINKIKEGLSSNGFPAELFDYVSPFGVVSLLALKSFNCPNPQDLALMEKELQKIASNDNKPIKELETLQFQFDVLNSVFTADELYKYITELNEHNALTPRMVQAYKDENLAEFNAIMFDNSYLTKENQEILLNKRNANWMNSMPSQMKENATFFAVGAGHLIGENGMINLLKKAGYTLTPIFN